MSHTVYKRLDRDVISTLSRITPWRSTLALALDWGMIIGAIALTEAYFSWPLYVLAVIFIGTRYHALGVIVHEATHFRLFKNRKLNDWVGEICAAWPLLITLYGYRRNHLAHHREVNTNQDPDWNRKLDDPYFDLPRTKQSFIGLLLKAITGFRFVVEARNVLKSKELNALPRNLQQARMVFYVCVFTFALLFGVFSELLMYWLVPLITSFSFIMYVRSIAEHHGGTMHYEDVLTGSRHVNATWFERIFFPHNVNYHLDHHLYPAVPFYNLPKLHEKLLEQEVYRSRAHITEGYISGLFNECVVPARSR